MAEGSSTEGSEIIHQIVLKTRHRLHRVVCRALIEMFRASLGFRRGPRPMQVILVDVRLWKLRYESSCFTRYM